MNWITQYYASTLGKKVVMAVTGIILFLFVVGHMVGNLQVYQGQEKIDHYAVFLHSHAGPLWIVRSVLIFCVFVHVLAAVQLFIRNRRAKPIGYKGKADLGIDYSARTMIWSGPIIAAFLFYHLRQLTFGVFQGYEELHVYHNLIAAFSDKPAAIAYIVAMVFLCLHFYHGLWSLFQTLGLDHPRYNAYRRAFAVVVSIVIAAGNISIPLSEMLGWLKE